MKAAFFAVAVLALAIHPAIAAPKTFRTVGKVGRTNVEVVVVLHPQADKCAPALLSEIQRETLEKGQAYIRSHLGAVTKKSGTDASGEKEFFGVSYLAGCPSNGSAWIAFPAQGPNKSVSRFESGKGWSKMAPI